MIWLLTLLWSNIDPPISNNWSPLLWILIKSCKSDTFQLNTCVPGMPPTAVLWTLKLKHSIQFNLKLNHTVCCKLRVEKALTSHCPPCHKKLDFSQTLPNSPINKDIWGFQWHETLLSAAKVQQSVKAEKETKPDRMAPNHFLWPGEHLIESPTGRIWNWSNCLSCVLIVGN